VAVVHLTSCPTIPNVTLRLRRPYMSNVYVRLLQEDLAKLGYRVAVDGVYGPQTASAVSALQRRYLNSTTPHGRIVMDGVVGPATWCLVLSLAGTQTPTPTPTPSPITPSHTVGYVPPTIPIQVLPEMVLGQRFSYQWRATGGRPPYRWFLTSGSLPPGITLSASGLMQGIPTSVGTYTITIAVTDVHGHTATRSASLHVVAPVGTGFLSAIERLPSEIASRVHVPLLVVDAVGIAVVGGGLVWILRRAGGRSGRGGGRRGR
jgi:peptidoglycan hydrolase-like protein with peptidoglycan-binding domain